MSASHSSGPTLSIHDPEFKNLITVPLSAVHHLPPAHLEISRLVLCRKFDPRSPDSCAMGDSCKFVHIDMSVPELNVQSIHVNYAYRSLEEVAHERLPAGENLAVLAPNNRAPSQLVPSELVLLTKGAMNRHSNRGPLSHCAHYFYNRMCNRGERCGFLHCLYIDPTATDFQRAPPRAGAGYAPGAKPQAQKPQMSEPYQGRVQAASSTTAVVPPLAHHHPIVSRTSTTGVSTPPPTHSLQKALSYSSRSASSCDLSESPRSQSGASSDSLQHSGLSYSQSISHSATASSLHATTSATRAAAPVVTYRHNPYSLLEVTTIVA